MHVHGSLHLNMTIRVPEWPGAWTSQQTYKEKESLGSDADQTATVERLLTVLHCLRDYIHRFFSPMPPTAFTVNSEANIIVSLEQEQGVL